ncbi:hypothetical protein SAMN05421504_1021159 [Amycolatopsis xylanica]|uniref:Uncharacterized protein n=1 Tax=Amycolatopsis xylanica TaxID=589385 RepID=A0A1H3B2W0_9PSEU|nr:hypothetical protein [Amycolatopsis xylanica]SDX36263.1 hypothetical protein SAMN05421504_1021159 [Amycolatopsis xylanica]
MIELQLIDHDETDLEPDGFASSIQLVTPEVAVEILKQNEGNRKLDRATVEIYAGAMKRNEWRLSHQGIAIDQEGELLDGQHRLAAVVKSGKTVPMLVVRGVDRNSFSIVDTGKRRSASDSLRTIGAADVIHLAAALRYVHLCDTLPGDAAWSGHRARLTNDQILELHEKHPRMIECVRRARPVAGTIGIIASACASAIYLTRRSAPELDQEDWFNGVITGANLDEGDPRLRLRAFFLNARAQNGRRRMDAREHIAVYLKAWNGWVRGEKRQGLAFRKGESLPKPIEI